MELNPRIPGGAGFLSYQADLSYKRHHIDIWNQIVIEHKNPDKELLFTGCYSTVFLLNNYQFSYSSLNKALITNLPTFKRMKIIKKAACRPNTFSRLNTVAFILLASYNQQDLVSDIKKLIYFQENGHVFCQDSQTKRSTLANNPSGLYFQVAKDVLQACEPQLLTAKTCRQHLASNPDDLNAHLFLVNHYYQLQDFANAILHQEQVARLDPTSGCHNLACFYHLQGRMDEAKAQFLKALEVNTHAGILAEYSNFLYQQGRFHEAIPYLYQAVADSESDENLGYSIIEKSTLDYPLQGILELKRALEIRAIGLAYYLLARCYAKQQREADYDMTLNAFKHWCAAHPRLMEVTLWQLVAMPVRSVDLARSEVYAKPDSVISMYERRLCQGHTLCPDEFLELSQFWYHHRHDPTTALIYIELALQANHPTKVWLVKAQKLKANYLQAIDENQQATPKPNRSNALQTQTTWLLQELNPTKRSDALKASHGIGDSKQGELRHHLSCLTCCCLHFFQPLCCFQFIESTTDHADQLNEVLPVKHLH